MSYLKIPFVLLLIPVGWVILPVVLLFVPGTSEVLPRAFRWLDNFSGPLIDGLAGDWPFRVEKGMGIKVLYRDYAGPIKANVFWADATYVETAGPLQRYWRRYVWLAWRNPVDYAKGVLFGKKITNLKLEPLHQEIYFVKPWSKTFGLRVRIGYKSNSRADVMYQSTHPHLAQKYYLRYGLSVNPFHRLSKGK